MTICKYLKLGIKTTDRRCILLKDLMIVINSDLLTCMHKWGKSDLHDFRFYVNNILITITFVFM